MHFEMYFYDLTHYIDERDFTKGDDRLANSFDPQDIFFRKLYERYYPMLEAMCEGKVNRDDSYRELIDNCLQDVFLLASQSYDQLRDHPNIEAWLKKACNNRLIPYVKLLREKQRITSSLETVSEWQLGNEPDVGERSIIKLSANELIAELTTILSAQERQVFVSYFMQEKTIAETAKSQGASTGAVKATINRIRNKAKKLKNRENQNFFVLMLSFWLFDYFTK